MAFISSEYSVSERLVYCLRELRRRVDAGTQGNRGICSQLGLSRCSKSMLEYRELAAALAVAFEAWPENTRVRGFPVPSADGSNPADAYFSGHGHRWKGAYGANRIALLEHCILYFEAKCEEAENVIS